VVTVGSSVSERVTLGDSDIDSDIVYVPVRDRESVSKQDATPGVQNDEPSVVDISAGVVAANAAATTFPPPYFPHPAVITSTFPTLPVNRTILFTSRMLLSNNIVDERVTVATGPST
jgi:hypothetical protein